MHSIKLKIGDLELEATGFDSYEKFEPLLERAVEIWKDSSTSEPPQRLSTSEEAIQQPIVLNKDGIDISINSFVAKVGGATCRSLLKATAGYLVIAKGQERVTRDELVETAKTSTSWKKNYTAQIAINIRRMIQQGEITENATDVYSLPASVVGEMTASLNG